MKHKGDGFLIVASVKQKFVEAGISCADSIREYAPDASITFATEKRFVTDEIHDLCDIVLDDAPNHKRAKLWALPKTPYERTFYIDADCEVRSNRITEAFDLLGDDDIMLTKIREYAAAYVHFPGGSLVDHCGLFVYNSKPQTINFMHKWWETYEMQCESWPWDEELYPSKHLREWDQWSYWWLMNKTEHAIKHSYFPEPDCIWNWVNTYQASREKIDIADVIIWHHTIKG
jgi:hypothetical protein